MNHILMILIERKIPFKVLEYIEWDINMEIGTLHLIYNENWIWITLQGNDFWKNWCPVGKKGQEEEIQKLVTLLENEGVIVNIDTDIIF